jgi:hypothetical protein
VEARVNPDHREHPVSPVETVARDRVIIARQHEPPQATETEIILPNNLLQNVELLLIHITEQFLYYKLLYMFLYCRSMEHT